MAGVTGRELRVAYARTNTWGTPASVTRQVLINGSDGMDAMPQIVDDDAMGQTFLQPGEVADLTPPTPTLQLQARYEDMDSLIAGAMGSATNPTVVSSQAANSLVAYQHLVQLAIELTHFWTIAIDFTQYVLEIPSIKMTGYTLRVGENGRMQIEFSTVGAKTNYDSVTNTNSTVYAARQAAVANRLFRKDGRWRMNVQEGGSLGASDVNGLVKEITFGTTRPVAGDDFVFNQNYIIEPDDTGYPEFPVELTFARMNTVTANSLAIALGTAKVFKADWFFQGPFINSTTRRSFLFEMPELQIRNFRAVAAGAEQVRPFATFHAKLAATSPSGMAVVNPIQLTIVNANSQNLLT